MAKNRKIVAGISWQPEILASLDRYAKTLMGATDAGFSDGAGHRSAIVNNMVARELKRLGFPAKFSTAKGGKRK